MPRRIDYADRGDFVIEGVCRVIRRAGLPGLSVRAVAAELAMSTSTLLHQFTDRARLVRVAAARVGAARGRDISYRAQRDGLLAFVPVCEAELERARVCVAFAELARSEPDLGPVVAVVKHEERDILDWLTERSLDEPRLDVLAGVVDGVVAAMFATEDAWTHERAEAALLDCARGLGLPERALPERDVPEGDLPGPVTSAS